MSNVIEVKFVCERLTKFGFADKRHIRLYGEELALISNPVPDGDGFAVEAINRRSGTKKRVRIPLSLVHTLKRELAVQRRAAEQFAEKAAA
ncbi:MAG TPA: hypothetical protein VLW06_01660 [Terriglobales bacterium]|nr:hypothetical protein [Terriglobales bacterium]